MNTNIKTIKLGENTTALQKHFIRHYLRIAREERDTEKVNHYVIRKLKDGGVNFTEVA